MSKTYKKLLMLSSVFVLALFSTKLVQAAELPMQKNVIHVNGKATIKVKPNIAYINTMVLTEDKDAKKAQEDNAKIIEKIKKDIISKYKLKEEDINTVYYGVSPSYDYVGGKQVFRNYGVQHSLEITLNDIQKVGEMVDTLIASGATTINNVKLSLKDANEAYNMALQKAIQNAMQKAGAITTTLGVKQATPISITEQGESQGTIQERNMSMEDSLTGSNKSTTTSIQQNDIEVIARVQVILQW